MSKNKGIAIGLALFCIAQWALAQEDVAVINRNAKNYFLNKTKIRDPFSLRDPFKRPHLVEKIEEEGKGGKFNEEGIFTNLPSIEDIDLKEIQITGVLIGKERRALAYVTGIGDIILKEGMKLGTEQAELKAILPGGIIVVEKIINVYGQHEYLETVIPISNTKSKAKKGKSAKRR
jgi:hypothetical protein